MPFCIRLPAGCCFIDGRRQSVFPFFGLSIAAWAPFVFLFFLCLSPFSSLAMPAEGFSWEAVISGHEVTPPRLIAVDKSKQQLYLLESRSPLRIAKTFICTTGQVIGDKLAQGDLKTPEGIYFVGQRLTRGLDYTLYGNEAYTLNYPNPIDKLRRKTGYGIWIHGRGEEITPLQTQGCVAMNNPDLEALGKILLPGTPVALASSLNKKAQATSADAQDMKILRKKVQDWAQAWSSRSPGMFDFYDKDAYSLAQGEPFSAFQEQKARLFRQLPWIQTTVSDVQILRGPGYWVTWFYQDYKAPNLSTKGVRRLYWGKTAKGDFRILGMEWVPGLDTGALLASAASPFPPQDSLPLSEEQATPLPQALAERDQARRTEPVAKESISAAQNAPQPAPVTAQPFARGYDHIEDPRIGPMAEPPQSKRLLAERQKASPAPLVPPAASTEKPAPQKPAPSTNVTGLRLPPALPSQGLAGPLPLPATPMPTSDPRYDLLPPRPPLPQSETSQQPADATPQVASATGTQRDSASKEPETALPQNESRLVAEVSPVAAPETRSAPSPEENQEQALARDIKNARDMIEAWRSAWQSGNLNQYMRYYDNKAVQGSRKGTAAIREQKKSLWARVAPASVKFGTIRIVPKGQTLVATMTQVYKDSSGNQDNGRKTLTLKRVGSNWRIVGEEWSKAR